ncbi:MAG TPA: glycosyltransferase family A protein [Eubacteriales bacterium]|mgnify:CR=1 FL=1|nr:glycosyltransferase family A protein [Eubacteriales bacterium]
MLFSVLVPIYNAGIYLEACVESVLRQSEQDFELVLVDDGSTDGSGEVCERFSARSPERVRTVHQKNQGLILARRTGIAQAKGDYCVFLDADDWLEDNALAVIHERIEKTGADIVIYDYYNRFEPNLSALPVKPVFQDGTVFRGEGKKRIYQMLIGSWRLNNLWNKAIRRELAQRDDTPYADFADNPHGEDLLQSLYPITHAETITYCAKPLYNYRRRSGSITTQISQQSIARQIGGDMNNGQLSRYMVLWGLDTPENRRLLAARKLQLMLTVFWQHYRAAKNTAEKRAVLNYPWQEAAERYHAADSRPALPLGKRMQLGAVLKKRKFFLDVTALLAGLQRKVKYGI